MSTSKRRFGIEDLESRLGPMTVGIYIRAFREADETSQVDFAKKLGLSRANLCDIEHDRKILSPDRAARIARLLKVPEAVLIQLAIQDDLRASKLAYRVELRKVG